MHLGPTIKIEEKLLKFAKNYTEQLQLCQFINSIIKHYYEFTWANNYLLEFMIRHLNSLTKLFDWDNQTALAAVKKLYNLPSENPNFESDDYYWLNNCLKDTILVLSSKLEHLSAVML